MIDLAVALAKDLGLRPAARALEIVVDRLNLRVKTPHWTTIRLWLCRLGLAVTQEQTDKGDGDRYWLADHSCQIGPEKALVILEVNGAPDGRPLGYDDVRTLLVKPGTQWKRADVAQCYVKLAEKHGWPAAIVTDGAVELRESIDDLNAARPPELKAETTLAIGDFKHKAANVLKGTLGKSERFTEFTKHVGQTRSSVQQTELAHLTPPATKPKSRFMNLSATLDWASMIVWLLRAPQAESRRWASDERLTEKFGWLLEFAEELESWRECLRVVGVGVELANAKGLYAGFEAEYRQRVGPLGCELSQTVASRLWEFVASSASSLSAHSRVPFSTEVLESSFARYKELEGQQSKGGFTSLLASFGALLVDWSPSSIRSALSRVSCKTVHEWTVATLGETLRSKRRATRREHRHTLAQSATESLSTS